MCLAGCFGRGLPPLATPTPETTLYYGRIELPKGISVQGVDVFRLGQVYFGGPPFTRSWYEGYFLREGLPPGDYYPAQFWADGRQHAFGWRADETRNVASAVQPGGCTYLGTFKIGNVTDRLIRTDTFEVEVIRNPSTEKEVLGWLIETMQGTGWDARLKERLAAL